MWSIFGVSKWHKRLCSFRLRHKGSFCFSMNLSYHLLISSLHLTNCFPHHPLAQMEQLLTTIIFPLRPYQLSLTISHCNLFNPKPVKLDHHLLPHLPRLNPFRPLLLTANPNLLFVDQLDLVDHPIT